VLCLTGNLAAQINIFTIPDGDVDGSNGLKNAINTSNTDGKDDIIILATNGTYTLSAVDNVTNEANGLPVIGADGAHSVTIHGHGSTITRSGSTPFRTLQATASSRVFIDNLTIANGLIDLFAPGYAVGAGIFNNGGTVTLTTCTFNSNSVHGRNGGDGISSEPNANDGDSGVGGAIGTSGGALTATGCTFNNNSAVGGKGGNGFSGVGGGKGGNGGAGHGGAIGITTSGSPATIDSCTFTNNSATGGNGGNSFGGNNKGIGATGTGGAIYVAATITRSVFNSNSAIAGQNGVPGGGFDPVAESFGGALDLIGTVAESTFTNNSAQHGGGILVHPNLGGLSVTATGCLFQNNSASIDGGAIYVGVEGSFFGNILGVLSMSNCTISGDSAPDGAAILNSGHASLVNCTLVGNNSSASGAGSVETYFPGDPGSLTNSILKTGTTGANVASNSITSQGHNISNDDAAGLLTATGDMPTTDPLLTSDTPGDYGGPTLTISIGVFDSSPAINHADPTYAPHRDQRGYFRTGPPDIGAFEHQGGVIGRVTAIARTGVNLNDVSVSFEAVDRLTYRLQRKGNTTDANWQDINGVNELTATGNDIEVITAPGDIILGKAFYHVTYASGP
jgi:hypothetical protein